MTLLVDSACGNPPFHNWQSDWHVTSTVFRAKFSKLVIFMRSCVMSYQTQMGRRAHRWDYRTLNVGSGIAKQRMTGGHLYGGPSGSQPQLSAEQRASGQDNSHGSGGMMIGLLVLKFGLVVWFPSDSDPRRWVSRRWGEESISQFPDGEHRVHNYRGRIDQHRCPGSRVSAGERVAGYAW